MTDYIQHVPLILFCFVTSIFFMVIVLPLVIRLSQEKKLFDYPDKRKNHLHPIPRLGGVLFAPIILVIALVVSFTESFFYLPHIHASEMFMSAGGLILIFMLGLNDDLGGVNFVEKLFIQFLSALFLMNNNIAIHSLNGLFGIYELPYMLSLGLTILLIIFTTNAMNLIDGIDGLASGISVIALVFYGLFFAKAAMWIYVALCASTIGLLIPFFYYNFCQVRCRIFMGDTGSLTLGYMLSFFMIHLLSYPFPSQAMSRGFVLLVLSALFIPLFDASRVLISRIILGKNPFSADRNHIHHRLLDLGISMRKVVLYILMSSLVLIIINWLLLKFIDCTFVLIIDLILTFSANFWIDYKRKQSLVIPK